MRSSSGLRGLSSTRKSTKPTSCSTSAAPFRAKRSSCARTESRDGIASVPSPRSASLAAVRTHHRSSASRRTNDGAASDPTTWPAARAACTRTNHSPSSRRATRAVPTAAPEREPSVSTTAARTFASESHVSSISVESASPGYGRSRVAPQNRTAGSQSRRSGTRRSPGAGARASSSAAIREREPWPRRSASMRMSIAQSSPMSPSVRIAAAAIRGSASSRTARTSWGTAGWWARSSRWSAVTRRQRPHSVRGRARTRRASRAARAELSAVEPGRASRRVVGRDAPEDDRPGKHNPARERDDEHGDGNAENQVVHHLSSSPTARSEPPSNGGSARIATIPLRACG